MTAVVDQTRAGIAFGPFILVAGERLLTKSGVPVPLSSRALDILIALTSTPHEIVSKKELMERTWPDVTVEEGSLRFHMAGLRKALGDGSRDPRYIMTVPGRGYCFIGAVSRQVWRDGGPPVDFPHANLPSPSDRTVGRHDDVLNVSAQLNTSRFVTIVGAGGVGKTTVAIEVGHHLRDSFASAVLFVDLGTLGHSALVPAAVASMLGLTVQSDDATPALAVYLSNKRILLILDTCEHLIDAAAGFAASIVAAAPNVYILATSREALRADREHIYRLDALACPPEDPGLTAAMVQSFPAAQLFIERATASGARFAMNDQDALIVASICRKLDGVALAIELAARRVGTFGLRETAVLLDQRLTLLWLGSRTAPARQKTLQATLDWSFGLLNEIERAVLRRLAVFVDHFTLDAALEVVTSATLDRSIVLVAIDSLVAKSIVATRPTGAAMRYRLLDTTRAYVLAIMIDDAEATDLSARHAAYHRRWLEQSGSEWSELATGMERTPYFAAVNNVRAALNWSFGPGGDVDIGVELVAAAAPIFLAMSLLPECHRWSERALAALADRGSDGFDAMHLQAALGVSLMFMRGARDGARIALERSLETAEMHGDALDQVRLLGPLNMFHLRAGNFTTALRYATRCSALAAGVEDPAAIAAAHAILGISLHLRGDLADARAELEAALERGGGSRHTTTVYLGFECRILARAILARNLWLQGSPDQAFDHARRAVEEAASMDHALTLAIALIWAVSVFLWADDVQGAETYCDALVACAEANSLTPHLLVARAFKGELAIRRGDADIGVEILQSSLQQLHAAPYELLSTELSIGLARGLAAGGRVDEAAALIDKAQDGIEANGDTLYGPELLRTRATLCLMPSWIDRGESEAQLLRALAASRRQGARVWELRAATDLAAWWIDQGRVSEARRLLRPIVEDCAGRAETAVLELAERLLAAPSQS